MNAKTIS